MLNVAAVVLAIAVGVLSGLPQHLASISLGEEYRGIPFLYQDNETVYLTRIHEFKDGHVNVTSPFLSDYKKSGASVMAPTGEYVYWVASGFGVLELSSVVAVSKYVFPALIFILVFVLALVLISKENPLRNLIALASGVVATLGYELVHVSTVLSLLTGAYDDVYLSVWTRLVHPVTGGIFLFTYLVCMALLIVQKKYWAAIPATLLLALMPGYIFAFGIALLTAVMYAVFAFINQERKVSAILGGVVAGAGILNAQHIVFLITSAGSSDATGALKGGLLFTHMPLVSTFLVLMLGVVLVAIAYEWRKERKFAFDSSLVFMGVILLASFLAMNQQVITGKTVWPQHFVQYTIPLCYVSLLILYSRYGSRFLGQWSAFLPVAVIASSLLIGIVALPTYANRLDDFRGIQAYAPLLEKLQSESGECVVFPVERVERINPYITAFTPCDVYLTHYVFVGVPEERIMHNFLSYMRFQGVTLDSVRSYLVEHPEKIWAVFFRDWKDVFRHSKDPWILSISDRHEIDSWLEEQQGRIADAYHAFYANDFRTELMRYDIEYVLVSYDDELQFDDRGYPFLMKVYEHDGIALYSLKP
jgi:hypothetical protein